MQRDRTPDLGLQRVADAERQLERAKNDRVRAWYSARASGASDAQIARAAGVAPSTVSKRLGPR